MADLAEVMGRLGTVDWSALDGESVRGVLVGLEDARRRLDSAVVAVVDQLDHRKLFREDGFRSATGYVKHVCRTSSGEAARRVRSAKTLRDLPETAAAYRAGQLGVEQLDVIARVHANPRVRDLLPTAQELLLEDAQRSSFTEFRELAREWERLADVDGSLADTERQHANRTATLREEFDGSWHLEAGYGSAQGAAMAEIFERYVRIELDADWDKAKAEHGPEASVEHLPRTDRQRRADALWNIFVTAASTPADAQRPEPLVNIVMTEAQFAEAAAQSAGDDPPEPTSDDHRQRRCSTLEGHAINPADGFAAALVGHVRRVVVDAQGVVIDLGRRSRLFTGSARDAALLANPDCGFTGCDQTGVHNQVDHTDEWQHGGTTDQVNAGPLCRFHNRWKSTHGYRLWRDPTGTWHTYKPDGTELL